MVTYYYDAYMGSTYVVKTDTYRQIYNIRRTNLKT